MQNLILNRSRMVLEKVIDKISTFWVLELCRVVWLQYVYIELPWVAASVERRTDFFRFFSEFLESCKMVGNRYKWPYKCIGDRNRTFWVYWGLRNVVLGMCMCIG